MALNAAKAGGTGGSKAPPLAPDNYMARVVQVLDLGVQNQRPYKGTEKPPAHEIMVTYELVTEFVPDDEGNPDETKPRWISERFPLYNLKADKAKSTKRYLALDPTQEFGGDFAALVGKACMVMISNNERDGRVYNNVGSVSGTPKGVGVPELVNETAVLDLDDPDMDVFNGLPDWIQTVIKEGLDYPHSTLAEKLGESDRVTEAGVPDEDDSFPV